MVKKDRKREELLDAALEVMLRYGARKATMEDIATKAGMATPSLYYYFKNKEEIVFATAERELERIVERIDVSFQAKGGLEQRLAGIWQASLYQPLEQKIEFEDFLEIISTVKELIPRLLNYQQQLVRRLLTEGIDAGKLHIDDLELATQSVSFAMSGVGQALIQGEQSELVLATLNELARLLIRGMRRPIEQQ